MRQAVFNCPLSIVNYQFLVIFVYETKKNNMPSILILEDDITFSLMLKTWLGRKGFEVSSVSSVSDARSRIEDASFDLILSDLRLPDGDGIDLLKWIKENNFLIPLIMMTSYAEIQTAVQAIKLGASDYIAKPLNPEELLGKIKDVIKTETGSVASATETLFGENLLEVGSKTVADHEYHLAEASTNGVIYGIVDDGFVAGTYPVHLLERSVTGSHAGSQHQ